MSRSLRSLANNIQTDPITLPCSLARTGNEASPCDMPGPCAILVGVVCYLLNLENYCAKSISHGNPRTISTSKIERYTTTVSGGGRNSSWWKSPSAPASLYNPNLWLTFSHCLYTVASGYKCIGMVMLTV